MVKNGWGWILIGYIGKKKKALWDNVWEIRLRRPTLKNCLQWWVCNLAPVVCNRVESAGTHQWGRNRDWKVLVPISGVGTVIGAVIIMMFSIAQSWSSRRSFSFGLDQSYLPTYLLQLEAVLFISLSSSLILLSSPPLPLTEGRLSVL